MEWSNEKALEFLELFRMEPCLWDPRLTSYKKRSAHCEAWRRILQALSFEVSLDELKKKKESLMGYYRIHLNKYKKSLNGAEEIYSTNWFAFDAMHSFLKPVYVPTTRIKTESMSEERIKEEIFLDEFLEIESAPENIESTESSSTNECKMKPVLNPNYPTHYKKLKTPPATPENFSKAATSKRKDELDEYDYFAGMIAAKLRKIENMDDREELMNTIQNLTFQCYMKSKQRNLTASKR